MKKPNKSFFILFSMFLILISCNKEIEQEEIIDEITEEELTEIFTRANTGIQLFTGETNLQVGLRQTYTVKLSKPLSVNTNFRIAANTPSAARFTKISDNTYSNNGYMDIGFPKGTQDIKFDMLPIKSIQNLSISISHNNGDVIHGILNNINVAAPVIEINAPNTCVQGGAFYFNIMHSHAYLGDRIMKLNYDKSYLKPNEIVKLNTGKGFTTIVDAIMPGETIIKATIIGVYRSGNVDYNYEIASSGDHKIKIEKNNTPETPPSTSPEEVYIKGSDAIKDYEIETYTLINSGYINHPSWSISNSSLVKMVSNGNQVKLQRISKGPGAFTLTAIYPVGKDSQRKVIKHIKLSNLFTIDDMELKDFDEESKTFYEYRFVNIPDDDFTTNWKVKGEGFNVIYETKTGLTLQAKSNQFNKRTDVIVTINSMGKTRTFYKTAITPARGGSGPLPPIGIQ